MTRKLFSVMLSAFALLLLMGAGVAPQQTVALVTEEESVPLSWATLETDVQSDDEADGGIRSAAVSASPLELAENTDESVLIDGEHAPADLGKTQRNGVTYVALASMAKALDESAQVNWDSASGIVTVTTAQLKLTAKVGQLYMEANGRYLYIPETVQLVNGRVVVPLTTVAKAFDAEVSWDAANSVVTVKRGSGAIQSGDSFYDQETLFWLSRVIYAESGNQCLEGQMAVGNVVMNRVASPAYPDTVEAVLAQKNQFTTYKSGALAKRTPSASSVIAAKLVMDGGEVEETKGALYFNSCSSGWVSRNRECIAVIGAHKFYR